MKLFFSILSTMFFSVLMSATSDADVPHCQKTAPISFEVYHHQSAYVAVIIVEGGKGHIDSLEKPHMGIGFYNDSPGVDVSCQDYGDSGTSINHVIACVYPNQMTSFLTMVGFTPIFENGDSCYSQKVAILTKAISFSDGIPITQCKNTSISDPAICETLTRNAITGKLPEKKEPLKDPYATPPSSPPAAQNCPAPNYIDKTGKCVSVAESKKDVCASGNYILLGGKGCGTSCGANQIAKMGKCVCQSNYILDPANPEKCIANPDLNVTPPQSATSGGGGCSLIR